MNRYDGKPFLWFLDCYVLSSIGHLDEDREYALNLSAPKLAETLGLSGSWFDMVAAQMELPLELPMKIAKIWQDGIAKSEALGLVVDPEEFARQFVDTNFPTDQ